MWIRRVIKSVYTPDATWGAEIAHGIICVLNPGWLQAAVPGNAKIQPSFAGRTLAHYRTGSENPGNCTCLRTRLRDGLKQAD